MFKTSILRLQIVWCYDWSCDRSISQRLIVRSVARCYDWSCDRSWHPTIDRTVGLRVLRLIVRSVTWCHECSYDRSHDATIARTIDRRRQRSIDRTVPSVTGRHDWSYIGRCSLPLVARFPNMALAIDVLQSFVIARPHVEIDRGMRPLLDIVANIADRSHLGPIATNRTIQKSYDPVWLWL